MSNATIASMIRFIRQLGAGGFGSVFLAKVEKSDHLVAIKHLRVQDKDEQDIPTRGRDALSP